MCSSDLSTSNACGAIFYGAGDCELTNNLFYNMVQDIKQAPSGIPALYNCVVGVDYSENILVKDNYFYTENIEKTFAATRQENSTNVTFENNTNKTTRK